VAQIVTMAVPVSKSVISSQMDRTISKIEKEALLWFSSKYPYLLLRGFEGTLEPLQINFKIGENVLFRQKDFSFFKTMMEHFKSTKFEHFKILFRQISHGLCLK
jgi:hypothetical protein